MADLPLAGLDLSLGGWSACVLLGGLVGLDGTSFPQAMISRPLVAATLGGWLFGSPDGGFLVGMALELLDLRTPPLGAARISEAGPAALIAGAAYASAGTGIAAYLAALSSGWLVSQVGGYTVDLLRRANGRLVGAPGQLGAPRRLERRHRLAIWLDGVRGALVTAAFLLPGLLLVRLVAALPAGAAGARPASLLLVAGLAAAAGAAARGLGTRRNLWYLVLVGGVLVLLAAP